jgi:hypothetical protein
MGVSDLVAAKGLGRQAFVKQCVQSQRVLASVIMQLKADMRELEGYYQPQPRPFQASARNICSIWSYGAITHKHSRRH